MLGLFIVSVMVLLVWFGPRPTLALKWAERALPTGFTGLAQWLQSSEQSFPGVPDGAQKHIIFANPDAPAPTGTVVLYIHGFTATRQEISPVPERIAEALGANYYGARLSGHGLDGESLGSATGEQWLEDTIEAWQIACELGENIIIVSCSTGGTLATWLAEQPSVQQKLAAMILFAPNFQPKHWATHMFGWPWSTYWVPWVLKKEHSWEPAGELNARYWTFRYPLKILHELQALVTAVRQSPVELIKAPSLFIYSEDDQVVSVEHIRRVYQRWGSEVKEQILMEGVAGESNHVITGDIVAPHNTRRNIEQVLDFLRRNTIGGAPLAGRNEQQGSGIGEIAVPANADTAGNASVRSASLLQSSYSSHAPRLQ